MHLPCSVIYGVRGHSPFKLHAPRRSVRDTMLSCGPCAEVELWALVGSSLDQETTHMKEAKRAEWRFNGSQPIMSIDTT